MSSLGWGFPGLSKRWHFFANGISLCGKWMLGGPMQPDNNSTHRDDCKECRKKLDARKRKEAQL